MKIIRLLTVLLAVFSGLISFTGCQEETRLKNIRRVRLVMDENLKLKERLKLRDAQKQKQEDRLAACEEEKTEIQKYMDDFIREQINNPPMTKLIRETSKKLEDLTLENEQLKTRIRELEAKLAQNSNQRNSP